MKTEDLQKTEQLLTELLELTEALAENTARRRFLRRQLLSSWEGRAADGLEEYLRKREAEEEKAEREFTALLEEGISMFRSRRETEQHWAGKFREVTGRENAGTPAGTAAGGFAGTAAEGFIDTAAEAPVEAAAETVAETAAEPSARGLSGASASGASAGRTISEPETVTDREKDAVIRRFEAANRELGDKLGSFFRRGGFTEDGSCAQQIRDIKYLTYTAPENYRTAFLKHLDSLNLSRPEDGSGEHYSGFLVNGVFVDLEHAGQDPRGAYTSFFHETAHGINDAAALFGSATDHYREDGSTLTDLIREDFRDRVSRELQEETAENGGLPLSRERRERIISVLLVSSEEETALSPGEENLKNRTAERIAGQLYGEQQECASDIYGGLTGNLLRGRAETADGRTVNGYGHETGYFYETERTIFGTERLTDRGKLEEEFFAEYFSCRMTGDRAAAAAVADPETGWLPGAAAMVDRLVERIAGQPD